MDQLKKFLEGLKKYSFWLVCLAVCGIVLATSILNARRMSQDRIKLESAINSDVAKIDKVQKTTAETGLDSLMAHPNRYTIEGMNEQIKLAGAEALEAWDLRYKSQSPSLVWPEDLLGQKTAAKFIDQPIPERFLHTGRLLNPADAANPIKSSDETDVEEISTINAQELDKYGQVIHKRMPQLASIIGAKWAFDPAAAENAAQANNADDEGVGAGNLLQGRGISANARDPGGVKVEKEVVEWRKGDQDRWYQLVSNFRISRLPTNRPTLPMALYIQQDLWLLESLFNVIKKVNGDADAKDNADIKKIDHIFFGKDALGMSGSIDAPKASLLKLAVDQGKKRDLPSPPRPKTSAPPVAAKFVLQANSRDFLNGRYVNGKFEPLASATVRTAIGVDKLSNNAELIVAKRIPFRIAVEMDERKIPKFLAACANSPFRFEVRQVRINRHVPGQTVGADGKAVGGETASQDESGATSGSKRAASNQLVKEVATRINYDVKVEFYGIVKVYNPVNYKLLQSPADTTPAQTAAN